MTGKQEMKDLAAMATSLLCLLLWAEVSAETYRSATYNYSIAFGDDWKRTEARDPSTDLLLLCINSLCGKSTGLDIAIGYLPQLRNGSAEDFLKQANGERLTRYIREVPEVKEFKILSEGRTALGAVPAYEVAIEFRYSEGGAMYGRIIHMFVTFDRGYIYKVSFSSDPEHYERDFALARDVLASFVIHSGEPF
jgi:hypothetical protein